LRVLEQSKIDGLNPTEAETLQAPFLFRDNYIFHHSLLSQTISYVLHGFQSVVFTEVFANTHHLMNVVLHFQAHKVFTLVNNLYLINFLVSQVFYPVFQKKNLRF